MKKTMFFITAAVIFAALMLTGCPNGIEPVEDPKLISITVTPNEIELGLDSGVKTFKLTATKNPADAKDNIEWTSSDPEKVTVDKDTGVITSVDLTDNDEPVTITAKSKQNPSISGVSLVTVTEGGVVLTGINVIPNSRNLVIGEKFQLSVSRIPATALDTIVWESSDDTKVSVSAAGEVTALAETIEGEPVIIKATSLELDDDTVFGSSLIIVTAAKKEYILKLHTTAAPEATADTNPTRELPDPVNNIFTISSLYAAGNWGSAGRFTDTTFVYVDQLLYGDFKIRIRSQITQKHSLGSTSASKGIVVGAFEPDVDGELNVDQDGTTGTSTKVVGIMHRNSGALRGIQPRTTDVNAAVGFNLTGVNTDLEYIYEVTRTANRMYYKYYVSKNGNVLGESDTGYTGGSGDGLGDTFIQPNTPVYAGIALLAVKANISQIELWDGDLDGEPVFYSGDSIPAPVAVHEIKLGVTDGTGVLLAPAGTGTATNPAEYITKVSDVITDGIQLSVSVVPDYADELGVTYWLAQGYDNSSTITVGEVSGLVSVTGPGTAIIQAISDDVAEPEYFLKIIVTDNYVPVENFNIVANTASMALGLETIDLSTDISYLVTNPVVVWTTSDSETVVFLDGTDEEDTVTGATAKIKGLKGGTAIITATATTSDGGSNTDTKTATITITVTTVMEKVDKLWNFSSQDFINFITDEGFATANIDKTLIYDGLTFIVEANNFGYGTTTQNGDFGDGVTVAVSRRYQAGIPTGIPSGASLEAGDFIPTNRAFKFTVAGACTISFFAANSNATSERDIVVSNGTAKVAGATRLEGNAWTVTNIDYTGPAGDLYMYCSDGGINWAAIRIKYDTGKEWNFSDAKFTNTTTGLLRPGWGAAPGIKENVTIDGLTVIHHAVEGENSCLYTAHTPSSSLGGDWGDYTPGSFTYRFQFNGTGSTTGRALKFDVSGPSKITVMAITGSNGSARPVVCHDGTNEIGRLDTDGTAGTSLMSKLVFNYAGDGGSIFLYSGNSGINVYAIKVEPAN